MDQNQNLPQSNNQNPQPAGQAPTDQKPAEQTPPQQPQNPTPPTEPAQPQGPTPPPPPSDSQPMGGSNPSPAAPVKHGKGGLIGAMVVFVLILLGAAGLIAAKGMHPMSAQKVMPTSTAQVSQAPTAGPSQSAVQEINNVDTGASDSSDLKDVQKDINTLNK